ncbi:carboxymuconolactone decarboxylase family protein [Cellulomonas fengjieae]|uniref:Carboxymuconolactone decarboxylase family protein n=1 Tax=Cellulomonas fengjieae TaxID=2819978 RepID=A0ABS3SFV7_9CELL|nr:carboxymuconolactone decarboxylase family protein [Cellulomonas fengjieae]MBO3084642.1 carboxymuconolactone decarboxylase family protein [Cellulomonas fengjieae]QVI67034.1 carboxymuconolactone decarboxylase family protein [Cellulomonas fengjieae]
MAWIRGATPDDDPAGEVTAAFDRDRATLGRVANYTRVFAHRPAVLRGWQGLNGAIKGMDPRRYEVATTAAALRLRSSYCALAHGDVLASKHMSAEAVRALADGGESDELTEVDRAVARLASTVAAGAADMQPEDLDELRALGFADDEILDVVLAAAARCFFSTVLDAVGALPDAAYRALDTPLRDALTVGRPIEAT